MSLNVVMTFFGSLNVCRGTIVSTAGPSHCTHTQRLKSHITFYYFLLIPFVTDLVTLHLVSVATTTTHTYPRKHLVSIPYFECYLSR